MLKLLRSHHLARGLLLLGVCLLILSALPARLASAADIALPLDNSLDNFTRGTFQRSSLSSLQASPAGNDLVGAVQLAPIGILNDWFNSPFLLPEKLTDVGAVAIGNRIFVVGGLVATTLTAHVWSTAIDQSTGAPLPPGWLAEPDLPALRTGDQYTSAVAARSVAAVTAVETNAATSSGYIYVIGGSVKPASAPQTVSSYGVSIAKVTNGRIDTTYGTNGWVISDAKSGCALCDIRLRVPPNQPPFSNGVQSASAVTFKVGGKTYIYLLGGLMRYREGTQILEVGSYLVFYAQVRASDGMLVKPSSTATPGWDSLNQIPATAGLSSQAGLWDASAVVDHFDVGGGIGGDALYLMGGQLQSNVNTGVQNAYNAKVFRALIGSDGKLTWTSAAGPSHWEGLLPTARIGMGAVDFQGTLYLTGGRPISGGAPSAPQPAVLTSYVEDDLTLADLGTNGSNFIINEGVLGGLTTPVPRVRHGSVVIPATSSSTSASEAAYVYVIAGQGSNTDTLPGDEQGSNTLIYGKIGKSEDVTKTGFTGSGWYYSTAHDMKSTTAVLRTIKWTTSITGTRPMDILIQYRTSTANDCNDSTAFNGSTWQPPNSWLDATGTGDSVYSNLGANQLNEAPAPTNPSHCLQYRAKLINSSTGAKITPALLYLSILVRVPGYPDLKVQTLKAQKDTSGSLTGLQVQIQNQNTSGDPTLPANLYGDQRGSFFVDMFVFPPGTTEKAPTLPLYLNPNNPPSKACASVTKDQMGVNVTLSISQWYNSDTDATCASQPKDIFSLFPTGGHYVVYVAVDSDGCTPHACVDEASTGGESNNLKRLEFDLPMSGPTKRTIFLPSVRR